jgi:DNA-binding PucR family transcriptional regulator
MTACDKDAFAGKGSGKPTSRWAAEKGRGKPTLGSALAPGHLQAKDGPGMWRVFLEQNAGELLVPLKRASHHQGVACAAEREATRAGKGVSERRRGRGRGRWGG